MGDRENEVRIDITGDVSGLKAATPQAVSRGQVIGYDAQMKGLTGTHLESAKALGTQLDALEANEKMMGRVKLAAAAAGAVIGVLAVASFRTMINETMEAEQSGARLEAVYRATGGAVKLTLEEIKAVGEDLYHWQRHSWRPMFTRGVSGGETR